MTFAASLVRRSAQGVFIYELYSFTEAGSDTGGSFGTGLATILAAVPAERAGTATAIRADWSGATVTVTNVAGPTSGEVLVIGY